MNTARQPNASVIWVLWDSEDGYRVFTNPSQCADEDQKFLVKFVCEKETALAPFDARTFKRDW